MTAAPTPLSALHEVFLGNDLFVSARNPEHFETYEKSQHPSVTMLTCCDSRMHQLVFNFDPIDRTFVVQNIGNQLQSGAGSVDYGVRHLKTPLLLIVGHTRCGAIAAARTDYRNESWEIVRELNGLHLPLKGVGTSGDTEADWLASAEANVDFQAEMAAARYAPEIAAGNLVVAGCIYDFVNLYGRGRGRLILMNLNGERNSSTLAASPLLETLDATVRTTIVGTRGIAPSRQ
ncbi:MAG TPA: carbonic anhydrase [Chthoniobacterales bacterium]|jgi:carbonic anhydrase